MAQDIRKLVVVGAIFFVSYGDVMFLSSHQSLTDHEVEIPETIKTQQLVKDLAKEIRLVEVSWPGEVETLTNIFLLFVTY